MLKKAVAVHAVFLIAVIVISFVFIVALFFQWIDVTQLGTSQATCFSKLLSYCSGWCRSCKSEPFDWNSKAPLGCEQIGYVKPSECVNPSSPACIEQCRKSGIKS